MVGYVSRRASAETRLQKGPGRSREVFAKSRRIPLKRRDSRKEKVLISLPCSLDSLPSALKKLPSDLETLASARRSLPHFLDLKKGKEAEHEVIVYCKDHPDEKIIHAIGVVFKDMRAEMGVKMK